MTIRRYRRDAVTKQGRGGDRLRSRIPGTSGVPIHPPTCPWHVLPQGDGLHLIEHSSIPSSTIRPNLDGLVITNRLVAIFDVATPKTTPPGLTNTFRDVLMHVLEQLAPGTPPFEAVKHITSELQRLTTCSGPSATVAIYDDELHTMIRVGDCNAMINGTEHNATMKVEERLASIRVAIDRAHLENGASIESLRRMSPGRQAILPALIAQQVLRNAPSSVPLRFGAFDGTSVPQDLVEVRSIDPQSELVLATDGYLELGATLDECEGVVALQASRDPLLLHGKPTTKPIAIDGDWHDDRTYVRLKVS
jgi:hypothetical protein